MSTSKAAYGPISGPITAGLGGLVIALGVRLAHQPPWLPIVIASIGAVATLIVCIRREAPQNATIYRVACWAAAGGWSTCTAWFGLSLWVWVTWFGITLFAAILAPAFAPQVDETKRDAAKQAGGFFGDMAATIQRVCSLKESVTVTPIREWPGRSGWTLGVEFAHGSSTTWRTIADYQLALAAALRLKIGCTITARSGAEHQGSAILDIALIDDVTTAVDYPSSYKPMSVRDEKPIGVYGDQTPALVETHQSSAVLGGMRGAGKTVLLHDMIANSVQCTDELVAIVDLNGGNLAAAWCEAQACGEIDGTVIDMIAVTDESACRVARVLLAIAKDRKARYAKLKLQHNVDILPVSRDLPAYTVYVDEGGEVAGDDASPAAKQAARDLRELQRIGRAECINVVFSVQRATSDYVPASMKKAAALKIMGMVDDAAELAHMFDWVKGISVDDLRQGVFFLRRDRSPIRRVRTYRLLPQQIRDIVFTVAPWRPTLDAAGRQAGGRLYADRWNFPDVEAYLARLRGEGDDDATSSADTTRDRSADVPAALADMVPDMGRLAQLVAEPEAPPVASDRIATVLSMDEQSITDQLAHLEDSFQQPAVTGTAEPVEPAIDISVEARQAFVVKLIAEAGADGMKTEDIVDATVKAGYTARRQTVSETLAAARREGLIKQKSGAYASWFRC
jgi:hypothetical protein